MNGNECLRSTVDLFRSDTYIGRYNMSRMESKYRYSGLLYDKLQCLLSYVYRNYDTIGIYFIPQFRYLSISVYKFFAIAMYLAFNHIKDVIIDGVNSNIRRAYFIKY